MKRRTFTTAVAAAALLPGLGKAQEGFPARTVTMVVPYAAGGATDVIARMVSEPLSKTWGQPVVVANRPGAGSVVAAESIARAAGDGYTLYMTTAAHTISASLYRKLAYDPIADFAPITLVATIPLVLVVSPSLPVNTVSELLAHLRTNPGTTFASPGNGSPQHLTMELFKSGNKLDLTHVPYKGDTPMITDLIGGQVRIAFVTLSAALPHIRAGKLRALALAHRQRIAAIGDVPTFAEAGVPSFEAATWFGIFAPASLPAALRQRIYRDVSKIVAEPAFTAKLVEMGADVDNSTPEAFEQLVRSEARRWAEAVRVSGAQVD